MVVHISKAQLDYFRRKARATNKEIYGILFGSVESADAVFVNYIDYPALEVQTVQGVTPSEADEQNAKEMAEDAGFIKIGTIHSHPGVPCYMSPSDHRSHLADGDIVSGIVEVVGGKTRVAFWQPYSSLPCTVKTYFNRNRD